MNKDEGVKSSESRKEPGRIRRTLKFWYSVLPGRKIDYFLLTLAALDVLLLLVRATYGGILGKGAPELLKFINPSIIVFDIFVVISWFFYFISRLRRSHNRMEFLRTHWYEILGMIPLIVFRPFLLLRIMKFAIAFYKLGRSERSVSGMITRDITFKFRDIIVDTIADAVFIRSLQRVEEVMLRLDYSELAHRAFQNHREEIRNAVNDALRSKSIVGEISKIPFMGGVADRLGEDLSQVIMEVLETNAAGNIMKDVTRGILGEMGERVRLLDVERITGQRIKLKKAAKKGAIPKEEID